MSASSSPSWLNNSIKLNLSFPMENSFWNITEGSIQVKQLKIIYLERKIMDL